MGIASINPATGLCIKSFKALEPAEIQGKVEGADQAFWSYKKLQWLSAANGCERRLIC